MLKLRKTLSLMLAVLLVTSFMPFSTASAHSNVAESTPADGAEVTEPIDTIEVTFDGGIQEGSTGVLIDENGEETEPAQVSINDNIMELIFDQEFSPGSYQLNFTILSADTHIVEDSISFSVAESAQSEDTQGTAEDAAPADEQSSEAGETDQQPTENNEQTGENGQETKQQSAPDTQTDSETDNSSVMTFVIIALIIVVILLVLWMIFGNKKNKQ